MLMWLETAYAVELDDELNNQSFIHNSVGGYRFHPGEYRTMVGTIRWQP